MSLVDRIEKLARQKNQTFKSLEREVGLGNGTIKRWERQSPRLDGLIKVAEYLQVSIDTLVFGERVSATGPDAAPAAEQPMICDGVPLSQMERDVVAMLRSLNPHDRKNAVDFITMLYEQKIGKKGSIYSTYIEDEYRQTSGPVEGDGESVIA